MTSTDTLTTVVVPGAHLMSALLGPRDQFLRRIEGQFPDNDVSVRGNEISVRGADSERVGRLFEELVGLLERGHELDDRTIDRSIGMVRSDERPTEVLTHQVLRGAKGRNVRPKTAGQKRYVDAIRNNIITFGIGPAGTGKSWLAVAMAVQALQAKQVQRIILTRPAVEAGERLGFLPGDLMAKIDPYLRPLYDALYDMVDPEGAAEADRAGHDRGRAAGVHAWPHAQQQLHHPRRGAEHHAGADEDVPDPHRLRIEGRRHRRRHPGRRRPTVGRVSRGSSGSSATWTIWPSCTSPPPTWCATRSWPTSSPPTNARPSRPTWPPDPNGREGRSPVGDPSSPTGIDMPTQVSVVVSDEQTDVAIDADRWAALATAVLRDEERTGELTLTFVDPTEMALLNEEHMGKPGPTDVLSFPLDDDPDDVVAGPVLLGDVVDLPVGRGRSRADHAGTVDDELALLTVHGVLHVLGHDHAEPAERRRDAGARTRPSRPTPLAGPGPDRFPTGTGGRMIAAALRSIDVLMLIVDLRPAAGADLLRRRRDGALEDDQAEGAPHSPTPVASPARRWSGWSSNRSAGSTRCC